MKKLTMLVIAALLLVASACEKGENGRIGKLKWNLDNGMLTISGKGEMPSTYREYCRCYAPPWYEYHMYIETAIVETGIINIGDGAFWSCYNLTSVSIPNSVTRIGECAFSGCSRLNSVTIPSNVTSIDDAAFSGCSNLTTITIPNSVVTIGNQAFSDCGSLTSIINLNPVPVAIDYSVFYAVDKSNCTLKVPIDAIPAYQNTEVWKEFNIVGL